MITSSQVAANKSNAQHSTGPRTPEGKAISCRNHFKHGCSGAFSVLPWESQQEFDMLLGSLRDEHKPCGVTEMILVDKMAQALWLSKRAQMLQHVTFNHEIPVCDDPKQLALYLRYQTTNERAFHKCLNDLLKLRAEKRRQEIGFESQRRKEADHLRREAAEKRKQDMHRINEMLLTSNLRFDNALALCKQEEEEEEKQHSINARKAA